MQLRPYTNNEHNIGRHEQEQTRTDMKRRTSISVKEEKIYIYISIFQRTVQYKYSITNVSYIINSIFCHKFLMIFILTT